MIAHALAAMAGFVRAHEDWAAPLAFCLAFGKSLAFVALVVPGVTLMLAIGGVVGASGIGLGPVWIAVSLGAALGDWVSYAIGARLKHRVHALWPLSRHPGMLPRAEEFFRRFGWLSVVLCRFVGPLRATVPLLCGVFEMPPLVFQLANWPSAFLWAAALLGPGEAVARWLR